MFYHNVLYLASNVMCLFFIPFFIDKRAEVRAQHFARTDTNQGVSFS